MIILSGIEFIQRHKLCGKTAIVHIGRLILFNGTFGDELLFVIFIKDDGTVLLSDIVALTVELSRIMYYPKYIEQFIKRNNLRVKDNLYYLCVACCTGRYFFVRRLVRMTSGIPRSDTDNTLSLFENGIYTPK